MNVAVHSALSYPPAPAGAVSTAPSSVTLYVVAVSSAYSVNSTLPPAGAVVLPSAFFHAFVALAVTYSLFTRVREIVPRSVLGSVDTEVVISVAVPPAGVAIHLPPV